MPRIMYGKRRYMIYRIIKQKRVISHVLRAKSASIIDLRSVEPPIVQLIVQPLIGKRRAV